LDEQSIVLDVGGYKGQWASDIYAKYGCTVHVFEPVPAFADAIATRFSRNSRIVVHRFGLADVTTRTRICVSADSSSVLRDGSAYAEIDLIRAADFFAEFRIGEVGLMKINIEGGEYQLLPHLIAEKLINRIVSLQVQFHDFVDNARELRDRIRAALRQTHEPTYSFDFIWENWKRLPVSGG
jgi:FkbM family methyltransferase